LHGTIAVKFLVAVLALSLLSFSTARAETIKVGATSGPHAEILEVVKENAAARGLTIQIVEFSDFIQPNAALAAGDLQANSYQHRPFLTAQIKAHGYDIVPVGKTVLFPIAFYSKRHKTLADVPVGASVALPNDPSNEARTLLLLQTTGLVKLRAGADLSATPLDVVDNPKHFKFVELEAAQLARALQDVDLGAVNTNYAIAAGLDPQKDSVLLEGPQSQYICDIVVRRQDADKPWVKTLVESYQSDNVKAFIAQKYKGSAVAGW
jgi:D-methionine transport system substrate-binding protein